MIRLMLLILLISANCIKMNCEEETSTSGIASEVLEKTELLSTDPEPLQSKAENNEAANDASKATEDIEEIRVSRSSSLSTRNKTQFDDASKLHSNEDVLTEKSAPDDIIGEIDTKVDKEVEEIQSRINSAEVLEEDTKSAENVEKQIEELAETSRPAPENEDRKAEDLLEASAENKVSDNEKASSKVDESDRNSEIKEINEKSDESGLDESLETRRMFSSSDFIVIDSKTRPDTTSNAVKPEMKIAFDQNLNTYNNFNEFGSVSNIKLINSSRTEPTPVPVKTTMPIAPRVATQEIFNQQYYPKFYPRPELNINFPNVNSAFQGPRDLPIYLKVKQDELQSKNQFIGEQNSQFKSSEENKYSNARNQQYHQSQRILDTPGTVTNKNFEDLRIETRVQMPRLYQNQVPTGFESFTGNKQLEYLKQDSRFRGQQFYHNQQKLNSDYNRPGNINQDAKNQMQGIVNSKTSLNNEQGNQYPLLLQPQGMIDSKINLKNKQLGTDRLTNSYSYQHSPNPQLFNVLNTPITIIPKNIRILFEKLASASEYPRKLQTNVYNNNNIRNYPYFINPNYRGDSFSYDQVLSYDHFMPRF